MRIYKKLSLPAFFSALVLLIPGFMTSSIPEKEIQSLIAKTNLFNLRFPQERVYLHLDRPSYFANDDLWFKAYVKGSPVNECNLYVEIINTSGQVVSKNLAWIEDGLAYGDIHLPDSLPGGMYQVRAYTNWMRNFDEVWFFRKNLLIWNGRDKKLVPETTELRVRDIDLQFFPEGGTFVTGIPNKVAFKAVDKQGKGIDLRGAVIDESGNRVVEIKSHHQGTGCFTIVPVKGKKYTAEVIFGDDLVKKTDLPKPGDEGVILTANALDPARIEIQVIRKFPDSDKELAPEYLLVAQSGGEVCHHEQFAIQQETTSFELKKNKLPGGIIKFTLFDSRLIPVCERLVFNNHVNVVHLVIKTDKTEYKRREPIKIGVAAFTDQGMPCLTNLSMSVFNTPAILNKEEHPGNIFTHFLLNSELKGIIENPAYYFKDDSITTLVALDHVMMTHGYREFEWKEILGDSFPEIDYQPEPSLELRGRVISANTHRPVVNGEVTMITLKSLLGVYKEKTDSLGKFVFSDLFFYDTVYVSLEAKTRNGKQSAYIEIDSSSTISPKSGYLPQFSVYRKEASRTIPGTIVEPTRNAGWKKWSVNDTVLIGEVNVTARKTYKDDGHPRIYLEADFVLDLAKSNDAPANIFDYIEGKIPGVIYEEKTKTFYARGNKLKIYMDGMEDRMGIVASLPSQWFDKVEYVRSGIFAGVNYAGGILFFYANRGGRFISTPKKSEHMEGARIIGYSVSRKFYTPSYEETPLAEIKEDHRNTLYWNPILKTDSSGVATAAFYQSDDIGDMKIVVEGVTSEGHLCRGISGYRVKY